MPLRKRPISARSLMNWRLAYAWPAEGTYAVASAIPVTTCKMKAMSVALPKTYHQPVLLGTGCSSAHRVQETSPVRSSTQASNRLITRPSRDGDRTRLDLDLPVPDSDRILGQRLRRGAGGHAAVGVVHAPVAGA